MPPRLMIWWLWVPCGINKHTSTVCSGQMTSAPCCEPLTVTPRGNSQSDGTFLRAMRPGQVLKGRLASKASHEQSRFCSNALRHARSATLSAVQPLPPGTLGRVPRCQVVA